MFATTNRMQVKLMLRARQEHFAQIADKAYLAPSTIAILTLAKSLSTKTKTGTFIISLFDFLF